MGNVIGKLVTPFTLKISMVCLFSLRERERKCVGKFEEIDWVVFENKIKRLPYKNNLSFCWRGKLSGEPVTPLYLKSSLVCVCWCRVRGRERGRKRKSLLFAARCKMFLTFYGMLTKGFVRAQARSQFEKLAEMIFDCKHRLREIFMANFPTQI